MNKVENDKLIQKIYFDPENPINIEVMPANENINLLSCKWICVPTPSGGFSCGLSCEF